MNDDDARLAEIIRMQSDLAAEAASIIARRSSKPAAIGAPARRPGRMINVSVAATIARKGTGWIYKHAMRYGFRWRLASGSWVVDEALLRAFLHGASEKSEKCEEREAREPLIKSCDLGKSLLI